MFRTIKKLILITFVNLISIPAALCQSQETKRPPIIPDSTQADKTLIIPTGGSENPEQYFGGAFLPTITRTVIAAAAGLAVLFIIIGGIQILTAYGNDEKIGQAKKTITFAIVGLLIAILSYAIVTIISSIQLAPPTSTTP